MFLASRVAAPKSARIMLWKLEGGGKEQEMGGRLPIMFEMCMIHTELRINCKLVQPSASCIPLRRAGARWDRG